jgi:RNA polymerase sigma-70 factor (ECF subfamily)
MIKARRETGMAESDEADLLARARAGEARSFEALLLPYLPMLFAYGRAICPDFHAAQDVVQETALVAFRNLGHFFADADFGTWLRAIARRQALAARRRLSRVKLGLESALERVFEDPAPEATALHRKALAECLKGLGERAERVIRAHYFEGTALANLAGAVGTTAAGAKQLLYRARQLLRDCVRRRLRPENA